MNPRDPLGTQAPAGYTVREWLEQVPISVSTLYDLWRNGGGPHRTRIGGRVIITESGTNYLARLTPPAT